MKLSRPSVAAMLTVVIAALALRHTSLLSPSDRSRQDGTFVPVAADVFRLTYSWYIPWLDVRVCIPLSSLQILDR